MEKVGDFEHVKRLQWFTHGFYKIELVDEHVVMSDLRMGAEPRYVFSFTVAKKTNDSSASEVSFTPIVPEQIEFEPDYSQLNGFWSRILGDRSQEWRSARKEHLK